MSGQGKNPAGRWLLADLLVEPDVRQVGPTCGLVALHLAAKTLWARAPPGRAPTEQTVCSAQELLTHAQQRGFSVQGEMFSALDLAALACDSCHLHASIVEDASPRDVCGLLARGRLVLLAYDADKDNTPCLLGGSRAHWALIRGLALPPPCEAAQHMLVAAHASQQEADNHLGPRCHGACHPLAPAHDGTDGTAHDTARHHLARHHLAIPTAHIASGGPSSASGGGRSCSNTRSCLDVALEWCCAGAHASLPCSCWWCNDTCLGLRRQHAQEGCGEWEGIVALCVHGKVYRVSLQCCVALCVCRRSVYASVKGDRVPLLLSFTLDDTCK